MATTTVKAPRITKSMKFDAIRAALIGESLPHGLTTDDLLAFVASEQALLTKKNTAEHKPTAKQVENDNIKAKIVEFLAGTPDGATCTTIQKSIPELADSGNQRVSALLRPMVAAGTVVRSVVKGKAIFSIGTVED